MASAVLSSISMLYVNLRSKFPPYGKCGPQQYFYVICQLTERVSPIWQVRSSAVFLCNMSTYGASFPHMASAVLSSISM